ncbi:uncharacterized protein BP01DRAFT_394157 [Aspergillus saccharolyticus JOP 1030-1]|uniref:Uncharacterized protein n=1 Tax=Aspergillus saccharolyticus JOP 1030-1 TaxID=1450539 RepID=A0A319A4Y6_9EURO|nr:hypothetical protein BP01DRAFT_394157 [Aspergillus saccharolyticus JOP 1030-1]PYH42482.1 hypothetical protein BP01DRAFT_394157 [Aspergillus saccharolyticus JOP 1030-1]
MQSKTLLASLLGLAAGVTAVTTANSTSTSIAAAVQLRLVDLDLGYQKTYFELERAAAGGSGAPTADTVITTYNTTVAAEKQDVESKAQPTMALPEAVQLALCNAYHSLVLNGNTLNNAWAEHAGLFDKTQKNTLQELFTTVNDETSRFFADVAQKVLPVCAAVVQADNAALYQSLNRAVVALDPSA